VSWGAPSGGAVSWGAASWGAPSGGATVCFEVSNYVIALCMDPGLLI
jgi:hypothetical protein